ncbi:unnamed protein product [Rangifer tarandus platyrhynchus]|uniref:Uncharacterized protein n=2 Tax=Rangifer tarandus platyrhynchus TaxID=3082113 RepID=A0ABN9A391_RANTA|nr:unnamed protein product [Rangifer tarandus platyrhynchus]CAI9713825.1 unnamed protein product [Rangifer tarandus platyrhynchus]
MGGGGGGGTGGGEQQTCQSGGASEAQEEDPLYDRTRSLEDREHSGEAVAQFPARARVLPPPDRPPPPRPLSVLPLRLRAVGPGAASRSPGRERERTGKAGEGWRERKGVAASRAAAASGLLTSGTNPSSCASAASLLAGERCP